MHYSIYIKSSFLVVMLILMAGCSSSDFNSSSPLSVDGLPDFTDNFNESGTHIQVSHVASFDPYSNTVSIAPDRTTLSHVDLSWLWKYYPFMLKFEVLDHDPDLRLLTLKIEFTNPLKRTLGDVRAIFKPEDEMVPVDIDGWTTRAGADIKNPDVYFAFGRNNPDGRLKTLESDAREITFSYKPPIEIKSVAFVLDAALNGNTAEPYFFGEPNQIGRLFYIQISDWQDDIITAFLHPSGGFSPVPLRMAPFGDGMWGTSIPDIPPGNYLCRITGESPESPGADEKTAIAVHWVDLKWPPDGPLVPLPRGLGIYGYSFRDPDTNTNPVNASEVMDKVKNGMGGDWIIAQYGQVCNSGHLSMYPHLPAYIQAMHNADPSVPIHINLDKMSFPPQHLDPCLHPPEKYTQLFWDHLLESIRGQILENPKFDSISGIHFDIEIFPMNYPKEELKAIYYRYADFLARLHLEPSLAGRNITCYEFEWRPRETPEDIPYLCTVDAFLPEVYYTRFDWSWDPSEYQTPYQRLWKDMGTYNFWSLDHGRPFYPILATFAGWIDGNEDTLGLITPCPQKAMRMIDDTCFGKSAFDTIDEFEIVKHRDVHGMFIERVILRLPTSESVYPSSGLAVYQLGDTNPSTVGDDIVACRTGYAVAKAASIVHDSRGILMHGIGLFRFENNMAWKAAIFGDPIRNGQIAGISGRVRFEDDLTLSDYPELWEKITIELINPLTPEIVDSPVYRTSVDLIGIDDGSYLFFDLPSEVVTIQAFADGWQSPAVTVDLRGSFVYRDNVDLIMQPE